MNRREKETIGLYVHIPFCAVKCFYCDFVAFAGKSAQVDRYIEALRSEALLYERDGVQPTTLYVGGGTPSELTAAQIDDLLWMLSNRFGPLEDFQEATFEANPDSLTPEKLDALAQGGISRLSIGLQAAQNRLLNVIGRRHTWEDFVRGYRQARERGFHISVDLMCGLPDQSRADAAESLTRLLSLEPDHISLYGLSVEDRTLFKKRAVRVDEDLSRVMLLDAYARLAEKGYDHYEISNFARPGRQSIHNLNYWRNGSYVGLGCGAAGCLQERRYQNEDLLVRYLSRIEAGKKPVRESERLEGKDRLGETVLLGLRRIAGLTLDPFIQSEFRSEIEGLLERGLVKLDGAGCSARLPKLRLTREGILLSNEVFREFVAPFNAPAGRKMPVLKEAV